MDMVTRFLRPPSGSFFLFGPRGAGKSTWARQAFPEALVIDLLQPDVFRAYAARPERLREAMAGHTARQVLIDEIQRVPALLSVVHALLEERMGARFILTGSSARKIKRSDVDLLAGRALLRTLHPFMAGELGKRFDLDRALHEGLVPVVVAAEDPRDVLASYVALYIQEEVKAEALVRNIGDFSRFLEVASLSHAAILNISSLARECEIGRKTAEGYLSVLQDLLLAYLVPVFARRARRALVAHPKFYFFDAGVCRSLRPRGPLDRDEEVGGALLEGLVVQHLKAWNAYRGAKNALHYWRTRGGVEVDVVLYGEDGLHAIEVKSTGRVRPEDLRGLTAFLEDYPEAGALLLYRGKERLRKGPITCLPVDEFLRGLDPRRALEHAR